MSNLPHPHTGPIKVPKNEELITAEASRITQLMAHGVIAMLLGFLLLIAPKSDSIFDYVHDLPGWPGLYSRLFVITGINLCYKVIWSKKTRNIWWSLVLVSVCYAIFGGLFILNVAKWILSGFEGATPVAYPIAIYIGYFVLLLLQLEASKSAPKEQHNGRSAN